MPTVVETAKLDIDADAAWERYGAFDALALWHPGVARVEGGGDLSGARRRVILRDGAEILEKLDDSDTGHHGYRYEIEETALPIANYSAEFRIDPDPAGGSVAVWTATFNATRDEAAVVADLRAFFRAGLDALAKRAHASGAAAATSPDR